MLNFKFDSLMNMPSSLMVLIVIGGLFWLIVLAFALSRNDFDPVTKFMWVFVIVAASIFGAILYLLIAPCAPCDSKASGDDVSEDATCASCRATIPAGSNTCTKCGWSYTDTKPQW